MIDCDLNFFCGEIVFIWFKKTSIPIGYCFGGC